MFSGLNPRIPNVSHHGLCGGINLGLLKGEGTVLYRGRGTVGSLSSTGKWESNENETKDHKYHLPKY